MTLEWYEARIYCYKYNSGNADNKYLTEDFKFVSAKEAFRFCELAERCVRRGLGGEFIEKYCPYTCGGTIEKILGVFKVTLTETQIVQP